MNAARTWNRYLALTAFVVLAVQSFAGVSARRTRRPAGNSLSQPPRASLGSEYGKLPLTFEPNVGQTDARVRFLARGGGMTVFFTDTEVTMVLRRQGEGKTPYGPTRREDSAGEAKQAVVRMKLVGAQQPAAWRSLEKRTRPVNPS